MSAHRRHWQLAWSLMRSLSLRARAGLVPAVEIATVTSFRWINEGAIQVHREVTSITLSRMFRSVASLDIASLVS